MFQLPSPLEELHGNLFSEKKVRVFIKRDDMIHPIVSGNKWRKLKYNIQQAKLEGKNTILTVGGAFSNHLVATAAAANEFSLKSIGIVRGEELNQHSNSNLKNCTDFGMQLVFIPRSQYAKRYDVDFFETIMAAHNWPASEIYSVPEGGANILAEKGCHEIVDEIEIPFDYLCTSAGTGATARGLLKRLTPKQQLLVFPALKTNDYSFLMGESKEGYAVFRDYALGGYAKKTPELVQFIRQFYLDHKVELDYVYTGKMLYGVMDLIQKDYFTKGSTLILLHTGGLVNGGFAK